MNAPPKLLVKLLTINILAMIVVILIITFSIHSLAADHFARLSAKFQIASADANAMFLEAVDRYLLGASVIGLLTASCLSLWLSVRLTRPVTSMQRVAALIASGEYEQRVTVKGCGEIDQLAIAFNEMAARLKQVDRSRKDFIVDLAHELRTPLTNIRGYTEGLRDGVIPGENAIFASLHDESLRLVRLVEDLMQRARADVAKQDLRIERYDLRTLIEQAVQPFQPRLQEQSLTIRFDLPAPLPVDVDPQRIRQVITNLMENALRYTPRDGKILGRAEQQESTLRVVIANDLEGTPVLTNELFERFHRGDASRSRDSGGAGLGLAIVRHLIEAHGGKVGIQSVDHRAEVWFELPRG